MAGDIIGRHAVMIPNIGTMHVRVDLLTAKCVEFADSDLNSSFVRTARMIITLVQWLAKLLPRGEIHLESLTLALGLEFPPARTSWVLIMVCST